MVVLPHRAKRINQPEMADIDLNFIASRLDRLTTETAAIRDDMRVLTAIVIRLDNTRERHEALLTDMLREMRAIPARIDDRVRKLEAPPMMPTSS
jgi:hypothetical protein